MAWNHGNITKNGPEDPSPKVVIGSVYYSDRFFERNYQNVDGVDITAENDLDLIKLCDLIVLWGGEDIHPQIYNQPVTHAHIYRQNKRDDFEIKAYKIARENGIPVLGVCRGAQLICALEGGSLWQHVSNHANGAHLCKMWDGRVITVNSLHHQMMRLPEGAELLGWSKDIRSPMKYSDRPEPIQTQDQEPEFAFFPKAKALCVQGHPEFGHRDTDIARMTIELLKTRLNIHLM